MVVAACENGKLSPGRLSQIPQFHSDLSAVTFEKIMEFIESKEHFGFLIKVKLSLILPISPPS